MAFSLLGPIVLIPGIGAPARWGSFEYFHGIQHFLGGLGVRTLLCPVPFWGDMQMRLGVIKASLPIGPFHLVGHSQGGLEARLVAADPAYRGRVLSVTSINSPHAGTSLAEWGSRMFPEDQTLQMLTPEHCLPFMRKMAPDQKETAYFSIQTAIKKPHLLNSWPIFWPCYKYISHREGENDGFVPLSSSEHGEVILRDYGDHVAPIALPFGWRAHDLSKRVFRTIFERIIKEKL